MWSLLSLKLFSAFLGLEGLICMIGVSAVLVTKFIPSIYSHFVKFQSGYLVCDKISSMLVLLTLWMSLLMILAMSKAKEKNLLMTKFALLKWMLISSFFSSKFFLFFVFFELSLMPTLFIMLGWGMQPERITAGSYLIIYTTMGSVPLLMSMFHLMYMFGSCDMNLLKVKVTFMKLSGNFWLTTFWILAFMMKLPIYGVHLWLPKAHVEAPVAGSMMLAGVLLKLGAYGLLRAMSFLNLKKSFSWNMMLSWLIGSMAIVGLMCFRQCDLKSLVAYSSVAHMSLVMCALFSLDYVGVKGVMGMLVAHGMCSSGLFYGVQCLYEMSGTRKMALNRGFLVMSPSFCFFWFLLCACKASMPPSFNLFSELFLITSMMSYSSMLGLMCFLSVFLAGLFSIYLYVSVGHGKWSLLKNYWSSMSTRSLYILFLHVSPLFGLTFLSNYILM